jgi:predicted glycosyltransferase
LKALIVVTHLLGSGHLSRAATLARGLVAAGHEVSLVSGGLPAPHLPLDGLRVVQLPAIRSDGTAFTRLLDENGAPATDALLQKRKELLLETFEEIAPDIVITELFPFGRRMLREEFLALLARAKSSGAGIVASIRDVLNPPSKPEKAAQAEEIIATYYDAVLVHADPAVITLDASWPVSEVLAAKLRYTGFIAPALPDMAPHPAEEVDILVSAGGGAVGQQLFQAAREAAQLDPQRQWHLLVGGTGTARVIEDLRKGAPANLVVEPVRPDFRALLQHARTSISLCGYNTALDVLQTGIPAIFVPFDAANEREQTLRALALGALPAITVLASAALGPANLLREVAKLQEMPRRAAQTEGLDGAARSAEILTALRKRVS